MREEEEKKSSRGRGVRITARLQQLSKKSRRKERRVALAKLVAGVRAEWWRNETRSRVTEQKRQCGEEGPQRFVKAGQAHLFWGEGIR